MMGGVLSSRRSRLALRVVIGVAALWGLIAAAGGIADAFDAVVDMDRRWVAAGLGCALARLGLFGLQMHRLTSHLGCAPRRAYGLAWVVYGFGAITPAAPTEGLALAAGTLRNDGISRRDTALVLGFSEWFTQRTFYAVASVALLVTAALGDLPLDTQWPLMTAAIIVIAVLAITAWMARVPAVAGRVTVMADAVRYRNRPRPDPEASHAAGVAWHAAAMTIAGGPRRRVLTAMISATAVLADGGALWCMTRAAGLHLTFDIVLLAAISGTVASWIPLLPGGLGAVEAAIPAVLHAAGARFSSALAATITFRAASTAIPALLGAWAVVALRRPRRASAAADVPRFAPAEEER